MLAEMQARTLGPRRQELGWQGSGFGAKDLASFGFSFPLFYIVESHSHVSNCHLIKSTNSKYKLVGG